MKTVYYGITANRLWHHIREGSLNAGNFTDYRVAGREEHKDELHGILHQLDNNSGNEIRLAYMWAVAGELATGDTAQYAYVLELLVDDNRILQENPDMCVVSTKEILPLACVHKAYPFKITPMDRQIAAAFWKLDPTCGEELAIPVDEYIHPCLSQSQVEIIFEEWKQREIPEPVPGKEFLVLAPVSDLSRMMYDDGTLCTVRDMRDKLENVAHNLLSHTWDYPRHERQVEGVIYVKGLHFKCDLANWLMNANVDHIRQLLEEGPGSDVAVQVVKDSAIYDASSAAAVLIHSILCVSSSYVGELRDVCEISLVFNTRKVKDWLKANREDCSWL